jgi:hypothetical protein
MLAALPAACTTTSTSPPAGPVSRAQTQADLATSDSQKKLWQQAVARNAVGGLDQLSTDKPVQRSQPVIVAEQAVIQRKPTALPEQVENAVIVLERPAVEEKFSGVANVKAVSGDFLDLTLANRGELRLQARVAGSQLRAKVGDSARVLLQGGDDPFRRSDVVAIALPEDDLIYALVGDRQPVRLSIDPYELSAYQTGKPEGNTLQVRVSVGKESHLLSPGEQADFPRRGLTVKILSSVAVHGDAAHLLPEPYRLEILGWRTRER